ncbi:hypothetical protein WJX73_003582 [Symbiochloris irregularis]|uniref:Uncharacterized protein n=1 Tax=Symbiochloris irregularis TaxID=706552 RepID=A0AAW1P1D7_9CHLO
MPLSNSLLRLILPTKIPARGRRVARYKTGSAVRSSEWAKEEWLHPIDRGGPFYGPEPPEFDLAEPDALVETNPETAPSLGLASVHEWWKFDASRELVAPAKRSWEGTDTPESVLYQHRAEFTGCLAPFLLSSENLAGPFGAGSLTLLTPPVAVGDGSFEMWDLRYGFDFLVPTPLDPSPLTVVLTGFAGAPTSESLFDLEVPDTF